MESSLIAFSIVLLIFAIPILFLILIKRKTFNIYEVWDLALKGDRLSIIYCGVIGVAFVSAFTAVIIILVRK